MPHLDEMIWQIVAQIPAGKVMTYGQIARLCGYPGHARYVGKTLKQLPEDTVLPWHRVINAKGEISFPADSNSYKKQRALLEAESIRFQGNRISLSVYRYN